MGLEAGPSSPLPPSFGTGAFRMFTLLVTGLTCLMASMVSGEAEAEADPHFFYNPYPSYPYYYPTSHYPYPTRFVKTSTAAATPEAPKKETVEAIPEAPAAVATPNALPSVPLIRRIVPFLDVLRTGDGVAWKRPDEVDDVTEPEPNQNKISWYNTVPYTQAYLNRIPASSYYY